MASVGAPRPASHESSPLLRGGGGGIGGGSSSSSYPGAVGSTRAASLAEQLQADEELARRMQEEEAAAMGRFGYQGAADDAAPRAAAAAVGGGGAGGGNGAGERAPREQVREALLGELVSQARFASISFWLVAILAAPQILLILVFSIQNWHKFNACDKPISLWLLVYAARLLLATGVSALPVLSPRRWHPLRPRYRQLNDSVNLIGFAVFIWGNFMIFDSQTCRDNNSAMFHLAFYILLLNYILALLPCLLLVCLAPCVICCLPFVIRMSGFLPPGLGLRLAGQQGATQRLIDKLPPPKRFERGMFGGSAAAAAAANAPPTPRPDQSPQINHEEPECAICLSNYQVGDEVRELPCQGLHHFHRRCVDDWLKVNATCPCCREELLPIMAGSRAPHPSRARAASQSNDQHPEQIQIDIRR